MGEADFCFAFFRAYAVGELSCQWLFSMVRAEWAACGFAAGFVFLEIPALFQRYRPKQRISFPRSVNAELTQRNGRASDIVDLTFIS